MCRFTKQKRCPFVFKNNLPPKPFDLIHIDICGPFHIPTEGGHKNFLTLVDDCTRTTWVYLLQTKAKVTKIVPELYTLK